MTILTIAADDVQFVWYYKTYIICQLEEFTSIYILKITIP